MFKILVIGFIFWGVGFAQNIDPTKCGNTKLEVLFLNGVLAKWSDAQSSRDEIAKIVESESDKKRISPNGLDDICYKYIYNQREGLYDFVEVLAQKIREANTSLSEKEVYKKVAEYWFSDRAWLANMPGDFPEKLKEAEIQRVQSTEYSTLHSDVAAVVSTDLQKRSVLVVSHSQGNLFANLLYDELKNGPFTEARLKHYANLQVGSAASHITAKEKSYGDYYTSKQDIIIAGLGKLGSILPPNVDTEYLENLFTDPTGHFFLGTYTNSDVKGKLDGTTNFVPMSEIFMDKLADLAEKIWEPKCPTPGRIVDTKFNICAQVLSVPKDLNENIVFELSSCNNEASLKEFESLFEDNLIAFYDTSKPRASSIYVNLNKYKVEGEKLKFSVPKSLISNYSDYNIQYRMDLKIMQKQFEYGDGQIAQCNDQLSIPIIFEGPNLFCSSKYFKHDELANVYVTESSTVELGSEKVSTRSLISVDYQHGGCEYGTKYKRCATPSNSRGLVCDSSVEGSYFGGNIYNSNIQNSIVGRGAQLMTVSNSTIKNSLLEYNTVNSTVINGAFHYILSNKWATCLNAWKEFPDHLLMGRSFTNWDSKLVYGGGGCWSSYQMSVKRCESGSSSCVNHDPHYIELDHFQEYLYK